MAFQNRDIGRKFEDVVDLSAGAKIGRPVQRNSTDGAGGLVAPITFMEWTIGHADLTTAATSEAETLSGFPVNAAPLKAEVFVDVDFSGGTVSACTVEVGDAGDEDELLTASNCFTGVQNTAWTDTPSAAIVGKFKREAAYAPIATFRSTTDNVVSLTAGSLRVRIYYALLPA